MKKISKRVVALLITVILLALAICPAAFAEETQTEKVPKVELVFSEPDAEGYLTASLMIYDAYFSGAQFGFSFDNTVLQFVDKKTKNPSEEFSDVATLYPFENENGIHRFTEALRTASNSEGKLRLGVYSLPSDASDEGARITVGEEGFKLYDFSMKALKNEDPSLAILDYASTIYPKEAILSDGVNDIAIDFKFVLPEVFGVTTEIINVVPIPPEPTLEVLRQERLVDSLILNIGNYAAVDDGYLKWIDDGNKNVVPFIEGERTFIPLRFVGEAFGAEVKWYDEDQGIKVTLDDIVVTMNIGKTAYTINGVEKEMDVAPFIKEGRTFIPIRYIGEALNKSVYWDSSLKLVIVTPLDKPWNPEGKAEKDILPDALLIISELVRDMKPVAAE